MGSTAVRSPRLPVGLNDCLNFDRFAQELLETLSDWAEEAA